MKRILILLLIISLVSINFFANPLPDTNNEYNDRSNESSNENAYFFLVSNNVDDMSGDLSRYLISVNSKVKIKLNSSIEKKISISLESLFNFKSLKYNHDNLHNLLYFSNLNVSKVTQSNGVYTIELLGELNQVGSVADAFVKMQITKTIEQYTNKYIIKLNNSEKNWRCALDKSGNCE